ncbi:MAG: acyl carrier protein [Desulfosarcina sp.]|nr:acyl carrier protein [Desulfobacterales bacterium]
MAGIEEPLTFLSYSREDSEFALKLAQDLRSAGLNIWIDQIDITAGMRWDRSIEKAMEACGCFIILLSPDSVGSFNVMDELAFALEERKKIVPVLYRSCKIPFRLRRIQYIDFTGKYDTSLVLLIRIFKMENDSVPPRARKTNRPDTSKVNVPKIKPENYITQQQERKLWDDLVEIIAEILGVDPDKITTQANFFDDLGADSLDAVELIIHFEEKYSIEIPDDEAEKLVTVGDAYQYGLDRLS